MLGLKIFVWVQTFDEGHSGLHVTSATLVCCKLLKISRYIGHTSKIRLLQSLLLNISTIALFDDTRTRKNSDQVQTCTSLCQLCVCSVHTTHCAGPWLWKGLRSVLTSDRGRQPSNGLFDVQYVNHVILFVHCAHIYFLLSVCLCAPVHVLVSQSRLFMGIWRTMRDCASLCFEPGNGHWSGNCVLGWTFPSSPQL